MGCAEEIANQKFASVMPKVAETPMKKSLKDFPGIKNGKPVSVAVYSFSDKTGQRKPSDNIAQLSSAVTQGGEIYLIKALMDLSDGKFFNVVERGSIEYLLKERQIIRNARKTFDGEKAKRLGALQFAGIMITGGVVESSQRINRGSADFCYNREDHFEHKRGIECVQILRYGD